MTKSIIKIIAITLTICSCALKSNNNYDAKNTLNMVETKKEKITVVDNSKKKHIGKRL